MCNICGRSFHQLLDTGPSNAPRDFSAIVSSGVDNIDAFLLGFSFTGTVGSSAKVDFTIVPRNDDGDQTTNPNDIDPVFRDAVQKAAREWSNVANLSFSFALPSSLFPDGNANRNIVFDKSVLQNNVLGVTSVAEVDSNNDAKVTKTTIDISSDFFVNSDYTAGNIAFVVMMHEIGHSLGLAHPDNITGAGQGIASLPDDEQNLDGSIMTSVVNTFGAETAVNGFPNGLMIYDILAIQYLYGINRAYHANSESYRFAGTESIVKAIWDAGGTDTVDQSGVNFSVTIDLQEGYDNVTRIGNNSLWFAFGSNIENAYGGNLADALTGNALGNVLEGGSGNDTITGNSGSDALQGNQGNDTIDGGTGDDLIRGGKDNDTLQGGEGNDIINGNLGSDIVIGGNGNDLLRGGDSSDIIFAGSGNDTIYGDIGDDRINSGAGADVIVMNVAAGNDTLEAFASGSDQIWVSSSLFGTAADVVSATSSTTGGLLITFSSTQSLFLLGSSSISESDFVIFS